MARKVFATCAGMGPKPARWTIWGGMSLLLSLREKAKAALDQHADTAILPPRKRTDQAAIAITVYVFESGCHPARSASNPSLISDQDALNALPGTRLSRATSSHAYNPQGITSVA